MQFLGGEQQRAAAANALGMGREPQLVSRGAQMWVGTLQLHLLLSSLLLRPTPWFGHK